MILSLLIFLDFTGKFLILQNVAAAIMMWMIYYTALMIVVLPGGLD
jgi:hypothetical protein